MAIFNLTYSVTNAVIEVLRQALMSDPTFQKDRTGKSRSAETLVFDAWGYQVRDFPIVVVTGQSGANRRMDISDKVRSFFGLRIKEAPGSGDSTTSRKFILPEIAFLDQNVEIEYLGEPKTTPSKVTLLVKVEEVNGNDQFFVEFTGANVGTASVFPLSKFAARSLNTPTGEVRGGWFDLTIDLTCAARSTQERELLADKVWSSLWFTKKKELRKKGVVILDIRHGGNTQEPYGVDLLYFARMSMSCATEFEAVVPYKETIEGVGVQVTVIT